jgi:hypothetical protein
MSTWTCYCCGAQAHRLTTELAKSTTIGGITWTFVNAIIPCMKLMSKAAVSAIVIGHEKSVEPVEKETE